MIDFIIYSRNKTCSLSVSLYRNIKQYGQHMRSKSDHLPVLICSKFKIFGSLQRGTGNETVAMAKFNECHFVPYLMYITGAKFEQHPSKVFGDILVQSFLQFVTSSIFETCIPLEREEVFQNKKHHFERSLK